MPLMRLLDESRAFGPKATAVLLEAFTSVIAELDLRSNADKERAARRSTATRRSGRASTCTQSRPSRWGDCLLALQGPRARHDRPVEIQQLSAAGAYGPLRASQSRRQRRRW
jgi:hypothetical protein